MRDTGVPSANARSSCSSAVRPPRARASGAQLGGDRRRGPCGGPRVRRQHRSAFDAGPRRRHDQARGPPAVVAARASTRVGAGTRGTPPPPGRRSSALARGSLPERSSEQRPQARRRDPGVRAGGSGGGMSGISSTGGLIVSPFPLSAARAAAAPPARRRKPRARTAGARGRKAGGEFLAGEREHRGRIGRLGGEVLLRVLHVARELLPIVLLVGERQGMRPLGDLDLLERGTRLEAGTVRARPASRRRRPAERWPRGPRRSRQLPPDALRHVPDDPLDPRRAVSSAPCGRSGSARDGQRRCRGLHRAQVERLRRDRASAGR